MSILIKGMDMPKSCDECPCLADHYKACNLSGNYFTEPTMIHKSRLPNCPLIELPPHGRLIDADALHIQLIDKELDQLQPWISFDDYREVLQIIDDAPTIIETSPYRYEMIGKTDKPHGIYIIKSEE